MITEKDLAAKAEQTSCAWARGFAQVQRGELSSREHGVLKRRMRKAEEALRDFRYKEQEN